MKQVVWDLRLGEDVVLVRGVRNNFANHMIKAQDIWVFTTEGDD
jgi:hypothetical protein